MGEWIWQQLTALIGRGAGGAAGNVGWNYAAGAASGATPTPTVEPIGGGQFGPQSAPAGDSTQVPGGVDPAWWAAMLAARAAQLPPERPAGAPPWAPF